MKNILLLIHDDPGQETRLQVALGLARALSGHLTCLDLTVVPELVGDYHAGAAGSMLLEEQAKSTRHCTRMRERLQRETVSFDWVQQTGFIAQSLDKRSRLADLVVLSTDADGQPFPRMTEAIGDLLVRTGKPVLAVPPTSNNHGAFGSILVAWDGSDDAEAAMIAAVPLLQIANTVVLYYVNDRSIDVSAEDAARYLSRHGVQAVIKREPIGVDRVGTALMWEAKMGHHDLVVMGGFGHSRTLEAIFGGVTHTMLDRSKVPMLIVHRR